MKQMQYARVLLVLASNILFAVDKVKKMHFIQYISSKTYL